MTAESRAALAAALERLFAGAESDAERLDRLTQALNSAANGIALLSDPEAMVSAFTSATLGLAHVRRAVQ